MAGRRLDRVFRTLHLANRAWGSDALGLENTLQPIVDPDKFDPPPTFTYGHAWLVKPGVGEFGMLALRIPSGSVEVEFLMASKAQKYFPTNDLGAFTFTTALAERPVGPGAFQIKAHRPGTTPKATLFRGITSTDPGLGQPILSNTPHTEYHSLGIFEGGPTFFVIVDVNPNANALYNIRWRERIP